MRKKKRNNILGAIVLISLVVVAGMAIVLITDPANDIPELFDLRIIVSNCVEENFTTTTLITVKILDSITDDLIEHIHLSGYINDDFNTVRNEAMMLHTLESASTLTLEFNIALTYTTTELYYGTIFLSSAMFVFQSVDDIRQYNVWYVADTSFIDISTNGEHYTYPVLVELMF